MVAPREIWWLIGSAPDFWSRVTGFESRISHNDPDKLQDNCVLIKKISGYRGKPTPTPNKDSRDFTRAKKQQNDFLTLTFWRIFQEQAADVENALGHLLSGTLHLNFPKQIPLCSEWIRETKKKRG